MPLLIVRGDDGELRALHNVCRHRAGPLAMCGERSARRLRCHYHGWTCSLDGRLLNATEMDELVQRGLASGSYEAGRLNPARENGVHHFHELLREAYRTST